MKNLTHILPCFYANISTGHGNPLQYSCLENPMDWGAWRAIVHMITENRIQDWSDLACMHTHKSTYFKNINGIMHAHMLSCFSCVWFFATLWTVAHLQGSTVHGIPARILECVAMPYSRESSWPRGQTFVSYVS